MGSTWHNPHIYLYYRGLLGDGVTVLSEEKVQVNVGGLAVIFIIFPAASPAR